MEKKLYSKPELKLLTACSEQVLAGSLSVTLSDEEYSGGGGAKEEDDFNLSIKSVWDD